MISCKHEWKMISETTTKSKFELMTGPGGEFSADSIPYPMFKRKHIQVVTCSKCGKLKRFVEEI